MDKRLLVAVIAALFLGAVLAPVILSQQGPLVQLAQEKSFEVDDGFFYRTEITRLPAHLEITENESRIGLSVEPYMLEFGILPKNITATKQIDIANKKDGPVKVKFRVYGNISPFIEISKDFILDSQANTSVMVKAKGEDVGAYTGEVRMIVKRPKNGWAEWLLYLA